MNATVVPIKTVEFEKPVEGGSCVAHAWARTPAPVPANEKSC